MCRRNSLRVSSGSPVDAERTSRSPLFANYDHLDDDDLAELPLKRIWTVAAQDDE